MRRKRRKEIPLFSSFLFEKHLLFQKSYLDLFGTKFTQRADHQLKNRGKRQKTGKNEMNRVIVILCDIGKSVCPRFIIAQSFQHYASDAVVCAIS